MAEDITGALLTEEQLQPETAVETPVAPSDPPLTQAEMRGLLAEFQAGVLGEVKNVTYRANQSVTDRLNSQLTAFQEANGARTNAMLLQMLGEDRGKEAIAQLEALDEKQKTQAELAELRAKTKQAPETPDPNAVVLYEYRTYQVPNYKAYAKAQQVPWGDEKDSKSLAYAVLNLEAKDWSEYTDKAFGVIQEWADAVHRRTETKENDVNIPAGMSSNGAIANDQAWLNAYADPGSKIEASRENAAKAARLMASGLMPKASRT